MHIAIQLDVHSFALSISFIPCIYFLFTNSSDENERKKKHKNKKKKLRKNYTKYFIRNESESFIAYKYIQHFA